MCQLCELFGHTLDQQATGLGLSQTINQGVDPAVASPIEAATVAGVLASGNTFIDAVVAGYGKWSGQVTYSFPSNVSAFGTPATYATAVDGFQQVSVQQMVAIQKILEGAGNAYGSVEAVCGLDFVQLADNTHRSSVNLQISQCDNFGGANLATARVADFPGSPIFPLFPDAAGDLWFGDDSGTGADDGLQGYRSPIQGNYSWVTHIHELGHALGLQHTHDGGVGPFGVTLPADRQSVEFSVMSYLSYNGAPGAFYTNEQFGHAQTFMMYDILALQYLYGADYATNSGNTTYTWSPTTGQMFVNGAGQGTPGANRVFLTIWDGGGIDTYDMSNYGSGVSIDLRPEMWSITSTTQLADLDAGSLDPGRIAHGNVYNSALFNNDSLSLIENAVGGSGSDTFIGNNVDNTFRGNAGNDTMNGGVGTDSAVFVGLRSAYTLTNLGGDSVRVSGPDGVDTLTNIERLVFTDQTLAWNTFDSPTFELASFGPGSGGWSSDNLYKRELADVNGDGKADIVGFGGAGVFVSLATSNGHFASPTFELASFGPDSGGWSSDNLYKRELADVNGDGKADIVGFGGSGVYVSLATSNGHFASPAFVLSSFGPDSGGWSSDNLYKRELADVNGDGKADIVGFGGSGVYVSLATSNGHFASPAFVLSSFGPDSGGWSSDDLYKRELADVNGDGKADIVGFGGSGVYVSLATSNGHFASPTFELASFGPNSGGWNSDNLYKRELADVNGDGRADIVGFGGAGVYVSLATSNGHFAAPTFELSVFGPNSGGWSSDDLYKRELADVDGDLRADIVGFGHAGVYVSQSEFLV